MRTSVTVAMDRRPRALPHSSIAANSMKVACLKPPSVTVSVAVVSTQKRELSYPYEGGRLED